MIFEKQIVNTYKGMMHARCDDNGTAFYFSAKDFSAIGEIDYNLICGIVKGVPRPYSVNTLDLIFNGIGFGKAIGEGGKIRLPENLFDSPIGNYIHYERLNYGDEKHSYVSFATDDAKIDFMRKLFFEFTQIIPGKYETTENIRYEANDG